MHTMGSFKFNTKNLSTYFNIFLNLDNFSAQFGGLVGLCSGFSLISVLEFIYWFSLRIWHDQRKRKKAEEAAEDIEINNKAEGISTKAKED